VAHVCVQEPGQEGSAVVSRVAREVDAGRCVFKDPVQMSNTTVHRPATLARSAFTASQRPVHTLKQAATPS
jgi:hypothetical protein